MPFDSAPSNEVRNDASQHAEQRQEFLLGDPRSAREWNDPDVTRCKFTQHFVRLLPFELAYPVD